MLANSPRDGLDRFTSAMIATSGRRSRFITSRGGVTPLAASLSRSSGVWPCRTARSARPPSRISSSTLTRFRNLLGSDALGPDGSEPAAVGRQQPPPPRELGAGPWGGPTPGAPGRLGPVETKPGWSCHFSGPAIGAYLAQDLAAAGVAGRVAEAEFVRLLLRATWRHAVGPCDSGVNQGAQRDDGEQGPAQVTGGEEPGQAIGDEGHLEPECHQPDR